MTSGFNSVSAETVIEKKENTVSLSFSVPKNSPYFDGHFPGMPVLPAVAQTELVLRFCARYLGTGIAVSQIKRLKFVTRILPSVPLLLKAELNDNILTYNITSPDGGILYSTGIYVLTQERNSSCVKQGFIIPVYRHGESACVTAKKLAVMGLPVILIDDGNDEETKKLLKDFTGKTNGVTLASLDKNTGKGGAVIRGLQKARELCLTHVLQVDADGQHDIERAKFFLDESAKNPSIVICGYPEYDESAPASRVNGRRISNFWAMIVTLSKELKDVLCGFRVYPVDAALNAIKTPFIDKRMGFDPEVLVRLYWKGVYPLYHPVKVNYPRGGISNFHAVRDNIRIGWMFTRLCAGMLLHLPVLIIRKIKRGKKTEIS
ncbi:MAG: glycosyltransferase [Treponema sp.]|jgi:hypothetical protein|nr:glycosyltransferase [Treponema sp.]